MEAYHPLWQVEVEVVTNLHQEEEGGHLLLLGEEKLIAGWVEAEAVQ